MADGLRDQLCAATAACDSSERRRLRSEGGSSVAAHCSRAPLSLVVRTVERLNEENDTA